MPASFPAASQISALESQFGDKMTAWMVPTGSPEPYNILFSMNDGTPVIVASGVTHEYPLQLNEYPDATIAVQYYNIEGGNHVAKTYLSEDGGETWTAV
jgi:hypothetical protein